MNGEVLPDISLQLNTWLRERTTLYFRCPQQPDARCGNVMRYGESIWFESRRPSGATDAWRLELKGWNRVAVSSAILLFCSDGVVLSNLRMRSDTCLPLNSCSAPSRL